MGKYAMTRQYKRVNDLYGRGGTFEVNDKKWIYAMSNTPFIGDLYRLNDNMRYMEDYLSSRGLTWDDVKYPTRVSGSGSASFIPETALKAFEKLYL